MAAVVPVRTPPAVASVKLDAVAAPMLGVTSVGDVSNTTPPDPVSPVMAAAKFVLLGVARNVATPAPSPLMPVLTGKPVQLVSTPLEGVPSAGVTRVGEVAKTAAPLPVSSVRAVARFALDGVAKNAATPAPRPLTPVEIGRPVQDVSTPLDGVPSAGVTRVGLSENTKAPDPVLSVTEVFKLALVGVARNAVIPAAGVTPAHVVRSAS